MILGPIDHVGWARASSIRTSASSAAGVLRKGPPDAVSSSRAHRRSRARATWAPARHWWIAQCSESTGTSSAPGVDRKRSTSGAAAISDSLLASARRRRPSQRGDGHGQPGEAHHRVERHVAERGGRLEALGADDAPRRRGAHGLARARGRGLVADDDHERADGAPPARRSRGRCSGQRRGRRPRSAPGSGRRPRGSGSRSSRSSRAG